MKFLYCLFILFFPISLLAAETPVKVVVTFSILGDLVQQIGGERIDLTTLVKVNADAHTFEASPSDSVALTDAALLFENGLGFENWLDDLYKASGSKARRVVVTKNIEPLKASEEEADHDDHGHHHHHHDSEFDPHAWHDVQRVISMIAVISKALQTADPDSASYYQQRQESYSQQLEELDQWIFAQVKKIPTEQRKIVTNHDSHGYFAARYDFKILNILGSLSSEAGDPSAAHLAKVIDQIKAAQVPAIFAENIMNPRLSEQVAKETGIQSVHTLYSGALSEASGEAGSYIAMMRYNVELIRDALLR